MALGGASNKLHEFAVGLPLATTRKALMPPIPITFRRFSLGFFVAPVPLMNRPKPTSLLIAKRLMTIIEIRPFRNGWEVYEDPGVQLVFLTLEQAIDYATSRACFRSGEIRVLNSNGAVERVIAFNEPDRML